jgi:ATP-dependent Clp protease adaptor protein ClpS
MDPDLPQGTITYQVVIYDDWDHTYNYVIDLLVAMQGVSAETAAEMAREVDTKGQITIRAKDAADAERIHGRVLGSGPDPLLPHSNSSLMVAIQTVKNGETQINASRSRKIDNRIECVSDEDMRRIQREGKSTYDAAVNVPAQPAQTYSLGFQIVLVVVACLIYLFWKIVR